MKYSCCCLAFFLVSLNSGPWLSGDVQDTKRNVLFISVDDLNDWTGFLGGHPQALTPHMDRLAEKGVVFTEAHCQAPICGPSRAAILTGKFPHSTGIYAQYNTGRMMDYLDKNHPDIVQLPDWFERHGYTSEAVGKITHGSGSGLFDVDHGRFEGFGPKPDTRFHYDPAWFPEKFGSTQTDWGAFPDRDEDMPDFKIASVAEKFLAEKHDRPFFFCVGFMRPHVPLYVPQPWLDKFPLDRIQTPMWKSDDLDDVPQAAHEVNETPQMPTTEWAISTDQWGRAVQAYLASVAFMDFQLGRVLSALESGPHADNTYIVLFSDHGYHMGEKNRFSKHTLWERSSRVPLIISGPGIAGGTRCASPVGLIDIYPTLTGLCGLNPNPSNEGRSLVGLLNSPGTTWNHPVLTTYGRGNHAVQTADFRLIRYYDGAMELYDHRTDPHEWTNLAGRDQYDSLIRQLTSYLPENEAQWAAPSSHKVNNHFLTYQQQFR